MTDDMADHLIHCPASRGTRTPGAEDQVSAFLSETGAPPGRTRAADLHAAFLGYAATHRWCTLLVATPTGFGRQTTKLGYRKIRDARGVVYIGGSA